MKMAKRVLTMVLTLALIASFCVMALPAMAADEATEGKACVLTTVNPDGTVELSRDAAAHNNWPSVRTITGVESAPAIDLTVTNTLYFDFEVTGCSWMIQMDFTGIFMKFAKGIVASTGGAALKTSDDDGTAGTYKGSINIMDYMKTIAADSADANAANAQTIAKMTKCIVPGMKLYVVDTGTSGKIKINSLYLGTADDATGANCKQMSIDLLYPEVESTDPITGVKFFPLDMNNGNGGYDDVWEVEAGDNFFQRWNEADAADDADDDSEESVTTKKDTDETTAKKATTTTKKGSTEAGSNNMILWIVIAAVAVVAIVVVVIIVLKKKGSTPPADK